MKFSRFALLGSAAAVFTAVAAQPALV